MTPFNIVNDLNIYLILGALLFSIGIFGALMHKTFIGMLISSELILSGASINIMAFNRFTVAEPDTGQIFTLFIMAVAAAEAAIVLSVILAIYRRYKSVETDSTSELKG